MFTIVIATNKGGSGKTTMAINLAVAAGEGALLVDLDPQASSVVWGEQRDGEDPGVLGIQGYQLEKVLNSAEDNGAEFVFIDTAPHSETAALAACRNADLVLCPCRPSLADIRALTHTVDLVKLAKAQGVVVFNAVPTAGLKIDAQNALQSIGLLLCPVSIGQRVAFNHSFTAGQGVTEYEPSGKAAAEISQLWRWVLKELKN